MSFTFLDLEQGSDDWNEHRINHWNSSEAPIIMGCNKKMPRNELMDLKAKGEVKTFSEWVENVLFQRGHNIESIVREKLNKTEGLGLRPAVSVIDGTKYSASLDGLSECLTVFMECKQWNQEKASWVMEHGTVPECDYWQVVHQFLCTPCETCLYVVSDGDTKTIITPIPRASIPESDFERLELAWVMFFDEMNKKVIKPENFPAISLNASFKVNYSNLGYYTNHIKGMFNALQKELSTDEQFVKAKNDIKICEKAENSIKEAEDKFLSEIGGFKQILDEFKDVKEFVRNIRLTLNKQVKKREDEIRSELCGNASKQVDEYWNEQASCLASPYSLPRSFYFFNAKDLIKNKKTKKSVQNALDDGVASAKLDILAIVTDITKKIKVIEELEDKERILPDRGHLAQRQTIEEILNIYKERRNKAQEESNKTPTTPTPTPAPTPESMPDVADSIQTTPTTRAIPIDVLKVLVSHSLLLRCLFEQGVQDWPGYEQAKIDHKARLKNEVEKFDKYK